MVGGFLLKYWDIRVSGREHLCHPAVFASNHQSYADPFVLGHIVPGLVPLAWSGYFKHPVLGPGLRWLGALSSSRVREAVRLIRSGESLLIFPEGRITRDGSVGHLHFGAAVMAIMAEVPIVPVTISGLYEAWPLVRTLPHRGRVHVQFHRRLGLQAPDVMLSKLQMVYQLHVPTK